MKNKNLISIIISDYNTEPTLLIKSIQSILDQTYKNIEIILIDDHSEIESKKVLTGINDSRIKIFRNNKNMGLANSLNIAIKKCKGIYIARMDTDDISYPDRIEREAQFLNQNNNIDMVGSRADYYDGISIWGESKYSGEIKKQDLIKGNVIIHPSVMFRKKAISNIGGYLDFNRCEDYATWIEMLYRGYRIVILNDKLIKYHLSIDDYKKRSLAKRKGIAKLIKTQYLKLNPSKTQILKSYIKNIISGLIPSKIMYYHHRKKAKLQ